MMSMPIKSYLCQASCCICSEHTPIWSETLFVLNDATWHSYITTIWSQAQYFPMIIIIILLYRRPAAPGENCPDVTRRTTSPSRMCGPNTGCRPSLAILRSQYSYGLRKTILRDLLLPSYVELVTGV